MSRAARSAAARSATARREVDVLVISLGTTFGLQAADEQLVRALQRAGLTVELARAAPVRAVRTLPLTDLTQALAARSAARAALRRVTPRRLIYSTTTAALLWPRPGAIRFDALAQATRPGRHGVWQRAVERRRLRAATLLLPWAEGSLAGADAAALARPRVVVPIAIGGDAAPGGASASAPADAVTGARSAAAALLATLAPGEQAVAVTYAADARKKGLDRLLAAWALVRRPGEQLLVTGRAQLPPELGTPAGVRCVGRLEPGVFPALVGAVGVLALAPRREDYGLVQLEALAEGARVVTCAATGPYAALPLIRALWPEQVVADGDDAAALGAALRHAIDAGSSEAERARAAAAVAPWQPAALQRRVERELVPTLFPERAS